MRKGFSIILLSFILAAGSAYGNPIQFDINLYTGWNLISPPFELEESSIEIALSSIDGLYRGVYWYDASNSDLLERWLIYDTSAPGHNTLDTIEVWKGYWIDISENCVLSLTGEQVEGTPPVVADEWNQMGLNYISEISTGDAMAFMAENYEYVYAYDASNPNPLERWLIYDTSAPDDSTLDMIQPWMGLWVKASGAVGDTPPEMPEPIPIPATVWLLGSALVGLVGFTRKFRKR